MANEVPFYLHGIVLPGGALVSQMTDVSPALNSDRLVAFASGHPEPLFVGKRKQTMDIPFTTRAVGTLLSTIAAGGNPYCIDLSASPVDLFYRKGKPLGMVYDLGDTEHHRLRVTKGFLYWQRIRAQHRQDATIQCRLLPLFDGTNNPILSAGTVALGTTPAIAEEYTVGPVKLNGSWIGGIQELEIALNEQVEEVSGDGEVFERYGALRTVAPTATIRTIREPFANLTVAGVALTGLDMFLTRKQPDLANYPASSAVHLKISATKGFAEPSEVREGANGPAVTGVFCQIRSANYNTRALAYTANTQIA